MTRIAIVDSNKCKPNKCAKECIKSCPPQKTGKKVIEIEDIGKNIAEKEQSLLNISNINDKKKIAKIIESLCIGCNICVRVCPFDAIKIINLPEEKPEDIIHRYNINGFRLYKLPILKKNIVSGIIGENGVGKTTLIDILSNTIRPNFEKFNIKLEDKEIISKFRGTVLQDYLKDLYGNKLTFSIKGQKIKSIIGGLNFVVRDFILSQGIDLNKELSDSYYNLEINKIINNNLNTLSGGELQRLLCWTVSMKDADVYIFDEPSNFLDVKQRLEISKLIRNTISKDKYIIVIEHDLSMLDYIADELYIVYGKPSAYGIVSKPLTSLEGINMYLSGYITSQNVRFRDEEFNLKPNKELEDNKIIVDKAQVNYYTYNNSEIIFPNYKLTIPSGSINLYSSLNVILGENGTGKTTFINWLSKHLNLVVSIKEQNLNIKKYLNKDGLFPSVMELFHQKIRNNFNNSTFQSDVVKSLDIEQLLDRKINELSGGELQRVQIVLCLGTDANIYLLDEPSANLDIDKRLKVTKVIKRFIINNNKSAFVVEHDIMMSVAFAQEMNSKIIVIKQDSFENNIKNCSITEPLDFNTGINNFLKIMDITMRLSGHNRPRINKFNSQLDQEQKKTNKYYGGK